MLFILHLIGDYCLQSHVMAIRKTTETTWALIHAAFYTLPFALALPLSPLQISIILLTHALIDRTAIARRWASLYGIGSTNGSLWHRWATTQGGNPIADAPDFLRVWLIILVDNTMHLCINAMAVYGLPMVDRPALFDQIPF